MTKIHSKFLWPLSHYNYFLMIWGFCSVYSSILPFPSFPTSLLKLVNITTFISALTVLPTSTLIPQLSISTAIRVILTKTCQTASLCSDLPVPFLLTKRKSKVLKDTQGHQEFPPPAPQLLDFVFLCSSPPLFYPPTLCSFWTYWVCSCLRISEFSGLS